MNICRFDGSCSRYSVSSSLFSSSSSSPSILAPILSIRGGSNTPDGSGGASFEVGANSSNGDIGDDKNEGSEMPTYVSIRMWTRQQATWAGVAADVGWLLARQGNLASAMECFKLSLVVAPRNWALRAKLMANMGTLLRGVWEHEMRTLQERLASGFHLHDSFDDELEEDNSVAGNTMKSPNILFRDDYSLQSSPPSKQQPELFLTGS